MIEILSMHACTPAQFYNESIKRNVHPAANIRRLSAINSEFLLWSNYFSFTSVGLGILLDKTGIGIGLFIMRFKCVRRLADDGAEVAVY